MRMTRTMRTPTNAQADRTPADDLDGGLATSSADIGARLWHVFISMRTGLALMLGLAALGLIGTLLAQADPALQGDRQAYAAWLESVRPRYGGWTGVLDALGLFTIFSSIWFRGIIVLLATNVGESFFAHAPLSARIASPTDPDAALAEVRAAFRARHFRTIVTQDGDTIQLYADRFRWGPFGTVIAHLSLILILAGALIGTAWGFRNNGLAVPVGSRVEVGYGTGLSIEARSFTDSYYTNGSPSDFTSDLVLYRNGAAVTAQTIRVNEPLRAGDVTVYQSFYGAAAVMQVTDPDGKVVFDRGVPLEWISEDGKRRVGQMTLPDTGLTAYVIGAASGEVDPQIKPGQMQIEVYETRGQRGPIASEVISQGRPTRIAGLDFAFIRERQFTGLIVARDPGAIFVLIGAGLLVFGIGLVFIFPLRRAWAVIRWRPDGSSILVGAISGRDVTLQSDFLRLVDEMKLALTGPSAS
jgi:cytochrome c biogenesis protein